MTKVLESQTTQELSELCASFDPVNASKKQIVNFRKLLGKLKNEKYPKGSGKKLSVKAKSIKAKAKKETK